MTRCKVKLPGKGGRAAMGAIGMSRGARAAGILLLLVLVVASPGQASEFTPPGDELSERIDGGYYTWVAPDGTIVTESAVVVGVGDSFIDEENRLWEVVSIDGDQVAVKDGGKVAMPDVSRELEAMERAARGEQPAAEAAGLWSWARSILAQATGGVDRRAVGIYHTHNDESYVPTSGTHSKEWGDIHVVGERLKEALEAKGLKVEWKSDSHLPHDGQAYLRSRRTAIEISRLRPATILDVHRDAIPSEEVYLTEIDGQEVSRVRLVVGRQNQNREANLEYAKRIKAIADEKYPGLIKGIFHARGNYNQDLGPRMILLEFGTHVTTLEQALRSTEMMAEVIAAAAGLAPGSGDGAVGSAGARTALWLILLAAAGAAGWYFLNKEGAFARLFQGKGRRGDGEAGT